VELSKSADKKDRDYQVIEEEELKEVLVTPERPYQERGGVRNTHR